MKALIGFPIMQQLQEKRIWAHFVESRWYLTAIPVCQPWTTTRPCPAGAEFLHIVIWCILHIESHFAEESHMFCLSGLSDIRDCSSCHRNRPKRSYGGARAWHHWRGDKRWKSWGCSRDINLLHFFAGFRSIRFGVLFIPFRFIL